MLSSVSSSGLAPDARIGGWTINVEEGTVVDGPPATEDSEDWSEISSNKAIAAVYKGKEITEFLSELFSHNPNFITMQRSAGPERWSGIPTFSLLPKCTWIRAKADGEPTREHTDYPYFYNNTTVISDHHLRGKLDKLQPEYTSDSAIPGETILCMMCDRHFRLRFLAPSPSRGMKSWHCPGCINLPCQEFTMWIPLTDIDIGDSRLAVVSESHTLSGYDNLIGHRELPSGFNKKIESTCMWHTPEFMQQGDIIIFNWKTHHASTINESGRFRLSIDARITTGLKQQALMDVESTSTGRSSKRIVRRIIDPQMMPPTSNHPPLVTRKELTKHRPPQMIMMATVDNEEALNFNCKQINMVIRQSTINGAGRGLFTSMPYKSRRATSPVSDRLGENNRIVAHMFGIIRPRTRYEQLIKYPSWAVGDAECEFVEDYAKGIVTVFDISDKLTTTDDEYYMFVSRQCPMVMMNDPRELSQSKRIVATLKFVPNFIPTQTGDKFQWDMIPLGIPDVDLPAGVEIFFRYHFTPRQWSSIRRRARSHFTQAMLLDNFNVQFKNVADFMSLQSSITSMSKFRYAIQVGPADKQQQELVNTHFTMQGSEQLPGLIGVKVIKTFKGEM